MANSTEDKDFDFFGEFESLSVDVTSKRTTCDNCKRPVTVCWCPFLPKETIRTESTVIVLQHPSEERQCLRTAPILMAALDSNKCRVIRGRRFSPTKNNFDIPTNEMILLYPGPKAVNVSDLPDVRQNGRPYTIVLIDGTWAQARGLYWSSPALHKIRQVQLNPTSCSKYVIKTQPTETCLSTVESAALALCILEGRPNISELLLRPLQAICDFQLQHGAVAHRSKASQKAEGVMRLTKRRKARPKVSSKKEASGTSQLSKVNGNIT